ncbi:hypothetical protein TRIATDRAFT_307024 [Trichoderma atroviride IMI 206040]|uniref:Uncharacterized protein n=1 Tax=Hypocrea atroviridis (strain ATCC 20476 / IMI 206040) TaxID=452589 RepID=G9NQG9_HYPAI|nr:uncharacterized protein TRIATDRAFT_307024 [Trichoderma atroviride IMI 206040]EHK47309.1 hypothetical protein TRIATDRAFT_307024 [Trichoderma atroviride IMI 206040]
MDPREAQNIKPSSPQDQSGGQLVQAKNSTTPLTKTLLQQLDTGNQKGLMMDRWLEETPNEEPFNGLIVTRSL